LTTTPGQPVADGRAVGDGPPGSAPGSHEGFTHGFLDIRPMIVQDEIRWAERTLARGRRQQVQNSSLPVLPPVSLVPSAG